MKFVADLHLHSKYSRAVSPQMMLQNIALWAGYKGIQIAATGDFTHPFWFDQLKKELEEAGNGLYRLKSTTDNPQLTTNKNLSKPDVNSQLSDVYFLLSCEVSSIYSQGGKVRRIHNLFFFPSLASVEKFNSQLLKRSANLRADGRPIVGINSRDLAAIALSCDKKALIIPAHAWTPWFSIFGSFSGFDSIDECFGDMDKYIYGIETGLSSDPAMNWQIADLDNRSILSFSDAHSLEKMGREATVFEADEISYDSIYKAISNNSTIKQLNNPKIAFTIEFHPEEGKYHFTGHRDCGFRQGPEKYSKDANICPVCAKTLTVGVMDRVEELKTRSQKLETRNQDGVKWVYKQDNSRPPYVSCVPLMEIIAEAQGTNVGTKKVRDIYFALINGLGNEFKVLMRADIAEIARLSQDKVAEGIEKVRRGDITVDPGYDGKFGVVKIWNHIQDEVSSAINNAQPQDQLSLLL